MFASEFVLEGVTAILFHADDIDASDELTEWRKDPKNENFSVKGDDRSPPWTWQTYLYTDSTHIVMPSDNIMVSLRQAGAKVPLKGNTSFKQTTQSGIIIREEFCEFRNGSGKQIAMKDIAALRSLDFKEQAALVRDFGCTLYKKRAKIGQAKHVRVRARFNQWSVHGRLEVVAEEITFDRLKQIFDIAGDGGLGDWRTACKTPGIFGRYRVKLKKL